MYVLLRLCYILDLITISVLDLTMHYSPFEHCSVRRGRTRNTATNSKSSKTNAGVKVSQDCDPAAGDRDAFFIASPRAESTFQQQSYIVKVLNLNLKYALLMSRQCVSKLRN